MKNKHGIGRIIKLVCLSAFFLIYVAPFLLIVMNSFKPKDQIVANPLKLPTHLSFSNYTQAFSIMNFSSAFVNTLIITVISVVVVIILASMTAYIYARKNWKVNKFFFFFMVAAMIIPFQAIMIPLVKIYGSMHMLNKWTLIFMYAGFGAPLAVFMYHGFIKSIPIELEEAATIDGASTLQTFWLIIFPLLRPITATMVILDVLWFWNDYLLPSLILTTPDQRTLTLSTFYFYGTYTVQYDLVMAGLVLTIIPVLIVYLLLQKQIIKGLMQGSVK
jgi:raffinose/stachyose/melibiose transport system permease protein